MSAQEFDDWLLYARLEPFDQERDDFRAGIIASTFFNMMKGEKVEPKSPGDFMFLGDPVEKPPATAADMHAKLLAWLPIKPKG